MSLQNWLGDKNITRFEGERGIGNLETVLKHLGYTGDNFKYGTITEKFLADNPGAIEKLIDFVEENFDPSFQSDSDEDEDREDEEIEDEEDED